ncbi:unnamed protein product [Effrenium voratum]|uniref:CBS domain-containing protein n=1 Tax=Effrenium voratum TaxID=2562239 RepID=A0AA36IUY9_9DINO|nr:unnamed protein product [Effrenium voratum]CAJ1420050.1 unnamed protein product [Effrenium voratum]
MTDPASDGWPAGKVFEAATQGFTYDDLVLMPGHANFEASEVELTSYVTKNIRLTMPVVSGPSDTVTEAKMATELALAGGLGIIHGNQSIQNQVEMVQAVKRFVSGFILEPKVLSPTHKLADLDKLKAATGIASVPVTENGQLGSKVVGIVTSRDSDLCEDRGEYLSRVMTEKLVTAKEPLAFEEALKVLKRKKVGKLLILDEEDRLVSMVTRSDLKKVRDYPSMSRDLSGKLLVGAAVPANEGQPDWPRASALAEAGANLLYLFGDGVDSQLELIRKLKMEYPAVDILAGPATSVREAKRLVQAGADGIVAGTGCDAGGDPVKAPIAVAVGRGEATMVYEVAFYVTRNYKLPVCAAGVRSSSQALLALSLGASSVMLREPLAGSEEAPGGGQATAPLHHAHSLVNSVATRYGASRAWERQVTVPRAVAAPVTHKSCVKAYLLYFTSGLRNGFQDLGFRNLPELHHGLEKELLRMECRLPYSIQLREACCQAAQQSQHPVVVPYSMSMR